MRFVIYGVGAVGGVVGASLAMAGRDVIGIARGAMLDAIQTEGGLTLISHRGRQVVPFPCVTHPRDIDWRADDVIILTMKTNDTSDALAELRAAGVFSQAIVCGQNGVANERMALRCFPNVFGAVVLLPAQFLEAGTVVAMAGPKFGLLDIGRYPSGAGDLTQALCLALDNENLGCTPVPNVMDGKYGKLLLNVGNAVTAVLGQKARRGKWYDAARQEAEAAYEAAGISHYSVDQNESRRIEMKRVELDGVTFSGSSTFQSMARGTGSVETEFLNGEIALLGRLHGVKTPVNTALTRATDRMVMDKIEPGTFREDDLEKMTNVIP